MSGLLILLGVGLALAYALSVWVIVHRMRRPPRRTYASAVARNLPGDPSEAEPPRSFRDLSITRGNRTLSAWKIEGDDPAGPIVIASPGWGDSRLSVVPRLRGLAPWSHSIVAWDPSGLGASPGRCALGTKRDIDDLVAIAADLSQPPGDGLARAVLLFGWSLGAGMSIVAGVELEQRGLPLAGVIAESPYRLAPTPSANYIRLLGLPYHANNPAAFWLLGIRLGVGPGWREFDRAEHAARLRAPLLILHGEQDEITPLEEAQTIAESKPDSQLATVAGAGHNNLWTDEEPARQSECILTAWAAELAPVIAAS